MKKTTFIHVPRTAGTSIQNYLENNFRIRKAKKEDFRYTDYINLDCICTSHISIDELFREKVLQKEWWEDSYKFAFVRNPWDRLVSIYHYYKSFRTRREYRSNYCLESFETFVQETIVNDKWVPSIELFAGRPHFQHVLPQISWLKPEIDYVGKFENLQNDWNVVCEKADIPPNKLTHLNAVYRKDYHDYYNTELQHIVAKYYQEDIDKFKYTF